MVNIIYIFGTRADLPLMERLTPNHKSDDLICDFPRIGPSRFGGGSPRPDESTLPAYRALGVVVTRSLQCSTMSRTTLSPTISAASSAGR